MTDHKEWNRIILSPDEIKVLTLLENEKPLSRNCIFEKLKIPQSTGAYLLRQLMNKKLIRKAPNLRDMRRTVYTVMKK